MLSHALALREGWATIVNVSEVGSLMWGMDRPGSDHDVVIVYALDPELILSGKVSRDPVVPDQHDVMIDGKRYDFSYYEVGKLISLLKKGNINAIWAITSPLCAFGSDLRDDLIEALHPPAKSILFSAIGIATSNLIDSEKRKQVRSPQKSLRSAMRTLRFSEVALTEGKYVFDPITHEVTPDEVKEYIKVVQDIGSSSPMPDQYDHEVLEDILLEYRLDLLR